VRILYYNWVDYLDADARGGGVSVYQRNIIAGLSDDPSIHCAFLSAGTSYDLRRRAPRIVTLQEGRSPRYALVNSGLIAPSHADFAGSAQLDHPATERVFADFVARTGPWDVIHFNNLEGLPANILDLKRKLPGTRFVLSLHNYYPFCPQVNLWHAERDSCANFEGGARCVTCLPAAPDPRMVRLSYAGRGRLSKLGMGPDSPVYERLFRPLGSFAWAQFRALRRKRSARRQEAAPPAPLKASPSAEAFARRRARMVALINAHCDSVLCVSDRVRQIALHHGIHASRLRTLHIGTREASEWHYTHPRAAFLRQDGTLHLAYLGYMRRDKGFHFLMRALAALPPETAGRIRLTVAARTGEAEALALMAAARPHLAELRHVDGYSHEMLREMLADVDLGLVPVVWEDNLPQVAIEMHSRHIPLITSDRGGAQELGRCPDLVFRANDTGSFHQVIGRVLDGSVTPARYWSQAMAPVSLPDHLTALKSVYQGAS